MVLIFSSEENLVVHILPGWWTSIFESPSLHSRIYNPLLIIILRPLPFTVQLGCNNVSTTSLFQKVFFLTHNLSCLSCQPINPRIIIIIIATLQAYINDDRSIILEDAFKSISNADDIFFRSSNFITNKRIFCNQTYKWLIHTQSQMDIVVKIRISKPVAMSTSF